MGLTVVGNPAARVMTSSPGRSRRSPSFGEVRAVIASRLADEPEFTSTASRTPTNLANSRSNCSAKRPVVSQKSSEESTSSSSSCSSKTRPEMGTGDDPGTNAGAGKASR